MLLHDAVTPGSIIHQRLLNSRRYIKAIYEKATACCNIRAREMPGKGSATKPHTNTYSLFSSLIYRQTYVFRYFPHSREG